MYNPRMGGARGVGAATCEDAGKIAFARDCIKVSNTLLLIFQGNTFTHSPKHIVVVKSRFLSTQQPVDTEVILDNYY